MTMLKFRKRRIYLDTASTTPIDNRVFKVMKPYFSLKAGNPSSLHQEGVQAKLILENSRKQIASILGAHADEIIFTSGGTEGDNLAIIGVAHGLLTKKKIDKPGHIITSVFEHQAVLESCRKLEREGWKITYVPVSGMGIVDLGILKQSLTPETVLVSIMYANNEIGTIQPIREIAKILREHRKNQGGDRLPYFHTDACQAPRFLPLVVEKLGVDLMTLNASKIYGPKGVGCLYIKRNTFLEPVIVGGGQERGLRSGTENLPSIVGFGEALFLAVEKNEEEGKKLSEIRDYFFTKLKKIPGTEINGHLTDRLPNNINVSFTGIMGEWVVISLDARGIACSTGSACSSQHKDDAHVIMALGHDRNYAENTVRFSLDRDTMKKDIDYVVRALTEILEKNKGIII